MNSLLNLNEKSLTEGRGDLDLDRDLQKFQKQMQILKSTRSF